MADDTGTPWFLPYPESTDDVRPYEDIQALATALHTALNTLLNPGWTTYTPALSSSGVLQPSLGVGGSVVGEYQRRGDLVVVNWLLTVGPATNLGAGTLFVGAPVNAHANAVAQNRGAGHVLDSGTIDRAGILKWETATKWAIIIAEDGVQVPDMNISQAYASGDKIAGTAIYRPA